MTRHYLDILADTIRQNWDAPALTDYATLDGGPGNSYTYGEMYCKIQWLMGRFRQLGIEQGDHIAICGENSANWVIAYLAIAAYQGISVTILHTQIPEEMVRQIDFADASTLIIDADIWQTLDASMLPQVKYVLSLTDFSSLIGNPIADAFVSPSITSEVAFNIQDLDALAQICFTSGSTARSKGVMLSYRNISANVEYNFAEFLCFWRRCSLSMLPSAHMYGLMLELIQPLCIGMHVHVVREMCISNLLDVCERVHPALIMLLPFVLEKLLCKYYSYSECIRVLGGEIMMIGIGGADISPLLDDWIKHTKLPVAVCYGMTECAPRISVSLQGKYMSSSVGHVVPGMQAKISPLGEILVRGENVMLGYYKDPEATAAKIDKDGWLHTGDRGHLDEDGYLYVEGRLNSDMIVLPSGENISPVKVESIVNACAGVEESIVIARNGKLVALVVLNHELPSPPTGSPTEQVSWGVFGEGQGVRLRNRLLAQINPQLPAYSQLFGIEFLSEPLARTEKKTLKRYLYK